LINYAGKSEECRTLFGDERQTYEKAQKQHYREGPPLNWQNSYISPYASMHPWEDWAETWSHYLHMRDVIEIGGQFHVSLRTESSPVRRSTVRLNAVKQDAFDQIIDAWIPLTYVINSLSRSMGFSDWYPFTISYAVISKLRYVHEIIATATILDHAMPKALMNHTGAG
jgi:hypothetical protein